MFVFKSAISFFQTWSKFQLLWHLPSQSASKVDLSTVYDKGKNGKLANLKLRNNFLWRHKRPATALSKCGQFIFITHDTCLIAWWWTNQIAMIGLPPACSWGPPDPMMERTQFSQKIHSSFLFSLHTQFVWHKHAVANLFTDFEFQLQRLWLVDGWKGRRGETLKVTSDIIGRSTKTEKYFLRKENKEMADLGDVGGDIWQYWSCRLTLPSGITNNVFDNGVALADTASFKKWIFFFEWIFWIFRKWIFFWMGILDFFKMNNVWNKYLSLSLPASTMVVVKCLKLFWYQSEIFNGTYFSPF